MSVTTPAPSLGTSAERATGIAWVFRRSRRIGWAMAFTVVGWSLVWAEALGLLHLVPIPAAVTLFLLGLLLIPFSGGAETLSDRQTAPAAETAVPDSRSMR